jgi:hypothetical protein
MSCQAFNLNGLGLNFRFGDVDNLNELCVFVRQLLLVLLVALTMALPWSCRNGGNLKVGRLDTAGPTGIGESVAANTGNWRKTHCRTSPRRAYRHEPHRTLMTKCADVAEFEAAGEKAANPPKASRVCGRE